MLLFPTRTDRRIQRTPWVNYALIAVNVVVFLLTERAVGESRPGLEQLLLNPLSPRFDQFITYQFLHAGKMHIIFNMLFLYVFGNAVEDRLGRAGYLFFYLAGGVAAGLGHCFTSNHPVLGASGAVAAVTGAYLALFPMSNVTIVYWFFFIGSFEVSSMLLILFQMGQNLLFHMTDTGGNTAYSAHLSGYALGFIVGMGLLFARVLPREPYDMLALIEHRRWRSRFQRLTQDGYQPWRGGKASAPIGVMKDSPENERLLAHRARINEAIGRHDLPEAARHYVAMIEQHRDQVLGQQQQLDVANHLMSDGRYDHAAAAYALFLRHFPRYPERQHVQLILGLIHGRYLDNPARARELLTDAMPRLSADDKTLAEAVLSELG